MRRILSLIKKNIITLFGLRNVFKLQIVNQKLWVDYNLRGIKEERDYSIIMQLARNKKCVFDVGANHGIISLLINQINKDVFIHAFEASEEAVNIINRNIALNNMTASIKVINTVIADRSGYAIPFYWEGSSGGASIFKGRLGHTTEILKSTLSIDDYTRQFNLFPDFIKIDIEGAEILAIKGMSEILKNIRPLIFLELHEFGDKKLFENAADILDFISGFRYQMIYLRNGQIITDTRILKDRGRCHVLIAPAEAASDNIIKSLSLNGL